MALMTASPVTTKGFFLDGKWIEAGDLVEIRSPYDQSIVGEVFQGRREHAEAAIAAAVKAFGTTRRLPAFERQRVLRQVLRRRNRTEVDSDETRGDDSWWPQRRLRA